MAGFSTLDAFLKTHAGQDPLFQAVAETVSAMAAASCGIRDLIARGQLDGDMAVVHGNGRGGGGDAPKALDLSADGIIQQNLRQAPVASYLSEELPAAIRFCKQAPLAVAVDPLDGSSNIETNVSIGTIFSILPEKTGAQDSDPAAAFLQPGSEQLAAGIFVYGPQLSLILSVGNGTCVFVYNSRLAAFQQIVDGVLIPQKTSEFAINMSNYRHWDETIRLYIDDCLVGEDGPRGKNFNMRWIASMVAEAYRITARGGIYLYPADRREGYGNGRLRLIYEANPIAMLMEQAGGKATSGRTRILDLQPDSIHQHVPLIFGSRDEVTRVERYICDPSSIAERGPLFAKRGLFRA